MKNYDQIPQKMLNEIYYPPRTDSAWYLEDLLNNAQIRYYNLGRHAIAEALRVSGVESGSRVLLPGFVCRDVPEAIRYVGAQPVYYPVTVDLNLSLRVEELTDAAAIIIVNYFGFPQNVAPFIEYRRRLGSMLIEDNAHGLFSKDENGCFLGTRGDLGVFSFRKTVPVPNGAALVFNSPDKVQEIGEHQSFNDEETSFGFRIKQGLRSLVPILGSHPLRIATSLLRFAREIRTGNEYPTASGDSLMTTSNSLPNKRMLSYLSLIDTERESSRRRSLYSYVSNVFHEMSIKPLFETLPENTVPFGFPFFAQPSEVTGIQRDLKKLGLSIFPWPDLPKDVGDTVPNELKNVWCVQFLW